MKKFLCFSNIIFGFPVSSSYLIIFPLRFQTDPDDATQMLAAAAGRRTSQALTRSSFILFSRPREGRLRPCVLVFLELERELSEWTIHESDSNHLSLFGHFWDANHDLNHFESKLYY